MGQELPSIGSAARVLVIKPSSLGDIIHGMQVMQSLQLALPDLRIDWVARDLFAPLLSQSAIVSQTFIFERKAGMASFVRLLRSIRRQRYNAVLDMQGLARSGLMTFAARAPLKAGRFDAREGARLFYNRLVSPPSRAGPWHALEILAEFGRLFGKIGVALQPLVWKELPANPLAGKSGWETRPYIVLFPESRRPEKCWPGFPGLARLILAQAKPETTVVWAGTKSAPMQEYDLHPRLVDLGGRTSLPETIALVRDAALVVANDSGPMHLAAAMGRPTIGIFGPTDPVRFGPRGPRMERVQTITADRGDLNLLSVEQVWRFLSSEFDYFPNDPVHG